MKFIHCSRKEFLERTKNQKLFLFGASFQPNEMIEDFKNFGKTDLIKRIVGIIDNDSSKQGKSYSLDGSKFRIHDINWLKKNNSVDTCVLITSRYYLSIIQQLEQIPELNNMYVYAYPCIILDKEGTEKEKYYSRFIQPSLDVYNEYLASLSINEREKVKMREKLLNKIQNSNFRFLPSIVLLHSNICTLKCENCCDLIPKVKKPYYLSADSIIRDLKKILTGLDICVRVDLTDGEAFLYRELETLLEFVLNEKKIETVFLYSNGTIIPNDSILQLMKNKKFFLRISDYGDNSKQKEFINLLKEQQINHTFMQDMTWWDFCVNDIRKRGDSRSLLKYDFIRCGNKKCSKALYQGKLYGCMPAFRMSDVGVFTSDQDYVIINETDKPDDIYRKIYNLCMINYIDACDYCHFGDTGLTLIKAGK